MPRFDYKCKTSAHTFEPLVLKGKDSVCATCGSDDLERLVSLPAVRSSSTTELSARGAKKCDQSQAAERTHAQAQYEQSHDRHG